ncbi:MAG: radical SAM protein [Candidatus Omnitrophota bacterium]
MNSTGNKLHAIENALPELRKLLSPCRLCHHECKIDRLTNAKGFCRAGSKVAVYSYSPHSGEEPPLSGSRGSGTIFFTHCSMRCVYCQNYEFSQLSDFEEIEADELSRRMIELQRLGCHNINLVSPTHYTCQIVEAVEMAVSDSLQIPIVYNTGGFDSPAVIKLLDGIVDVYLPDMRYSDSSMGKRFSGVADYAANNRKIVKEMFRQVGALQLDDRGLAKRGVIVRLLVLPGEISGTIETLHYLKKELSTDIYISLMSQYHPAYKASDIPEISRRPGEEEYIAITRAATDLGFRNGWIQGYRTDTHRFLGTRIKKGRFDWS